MEVGWMEERQHSQSAMNEKEAAESLAARDRGGEE
jgi:hypothetical protein